jgi:cytochrome c peroxidase
MMKLGKLLLVVVLFSGMGLVPFIISATRSNLAEIEPYQLDVPVGFPAPKIPEENALTQARIDLGRMLFYDPVMSVDSSISCAFCHDQSLAFADFRRVTPGVERRFGERNAPTLANVVYNPTLLFDGHLTTLEEQILVPIQEHAEFDFNIVLIGKRLRNNPKYVEMSLKAYNRMPDPYVITRAIASFERILISGNSPYDQYVYQNKKSALSKSQLKGMDLFQNQLHCTTCHSGFNFTNFSTQNNGLYEHYADSGRARVTLLVSDRAMFKVPTLRNIELTAPYMHDGSIATLEEVILHYESGGKNHLNKNPILQPFTLTKRQRKELISFLKSLTDPDFLTNPAFSNPF